MPRHPPPQLNSGMGKMTEAYRAFLVKNRSGHPLTRLAGVVWPNPPVVGGEVGGRGEGGRDPNHLIPDSHPMSKPAPPPPFAALTANGMGMHDRRHKRRRAGRGKESCGRMQRGKPGRSGQWAG